MKKNVIINVIVNDVGFVKLVTKEDWELQISLLKNVKNEHVKKQGGNDNLCPTGYLNNLLKIIYNVDVNPSECIVLVKMIMLFFGEEKTIKLDIKGNELFIHEIETDNIDDALKKMRDIDESLKEMRNIKNFKLEYNDTILSLN